MRSEWTAATRKISSWGNAALTLIAQGRSDVSGQRKSDQVVLVLSLCFAAALFEGADAVSLGLAAPTLGLVLQIRPTQLGLALSLTTLGLLVGATAGGRLSDRIGRKSVLIAAMAVLGLSSLATIVVGSLAQLYVLRTITGLGLGGLLPTLIAIASEVSGNSRKAGRVGKMFCGVPLGASLLGFLTAGVGLGWRAIFAVCGVGPLLLALVLAALLPETAPSAALADPGVERAPASFFSVLFAERRAARTLLLWTAAYFTSAAIWILVGWFPSLMVARGFSPFEAANLAALENLGAATGSVLVSRTYDVSRPWLIIGITYVGMAVLLMSLARVSGFLPTAIAGTTCGFFVTGGQLLLYAMIPQQYPPTGRGTGVGASVAFGRLGCISGPAMVGIMLGSGYGPSGVFLTMMPCLVVAGAALTLVANKSHGDIQRFPSG